LQFLKTKGRMSMLVSFLTLVTCATALKYAVFNSGYLEGDLVGRFNERGHVRVPVNSGTLLNDLTTNQVVMVVIAPVGSALATQDINDLNTYLKNHNGRVLLFADNSGNPVTARVNAVLQAFGAVSSVGGDANPESPSVNAHIATSVLTSGVEKILVGAAGLITTDRDNVLVREAKDPFRPPCRL
jgi:hypothetical protein